MRGQLSPTARPAGSSRQQGGRRPDGGAGVPLDPPDAVMEGVLTNRDRCMLGRSTSVLGHACTRPFTHSFLPTNGCFCLQR